MAGESPDGFGLLALLMAAIGLYGVIACLACYLPAARAAHVDPMVALRHETRRGNEERRAVW